MTQRLDKVKTDNVRGPSSNLATNGPEAQKENKHSSSDKIRRLHPYDADVPCKGANAKFIHDGASAHI